MAYAVQCCAYLRRLVWVVAWHTDCVYKRDMQLSSEQRLLHCAAWCALKAQARAEHDAQPQSVAIVLGLKLQDACMIVMHTCYNIRCESSIMLISN
jgi:hypothetical protein